MRVYTGIGSRETPIEVLEIFVNIGRYLGEQNYILRSGGANGADLAFEIGCDQSNGKKEIYIPWYRFNNSDSPLFKIPQEAYNIASIIHPNWVSLSENAKKLHARNCSQILGQDLKTPTDFVICYTKYGKEIGGTAQALRLARENNIKIFNVGSYSSIIEFKRDLFNYIKGIQ